MTKDVDRRIVGVLDTCVIIDYLHVDKDRLPDQATISAITLAELAIGPLLAKNPAERSLRTTRLVTAGANFDALPFDERAANVFSSLAGLISALGRNPKPRKLDLMIAATAVANGLPLYTRNVDDFKGLESQLTVVPV